MFLTLIFPLLTSLSSPAFTCIYCMFVELQQTSKAENDRLWEENNSVKTELSALSKALEPVFRIMSADSAEEGSSLLSRVHGVCDKL
uniref:Uncharacterized protein n=1 Tax=Arundo donax TaxID=35708 RepID=A0A0A9BW38_ARUDO